MAACSRLAYADGVTETTTTPAVKGVLFLSQFRYSFLISWHTYDLYPAALSAVMQAPNDIPHDFHFPGRSFSADCTSLIQANLHGDPLAIEFLCGEAPQPRVFQFRDIVSLSLFVEQLILRGIAVIDYGRSLTFYSRAHSQVFPYLPPTIRLDPFRATSLDVLWDSLCDLADSMIRFLGESGRLAIDPQFPLGNAVRFLSHRFLTQNERPADADPISSFLDDSGNIIDRDNFKDNVYFSGLSPCERARLLPFIFGLYDVHWPADQVARCEAELAAEFESLYTQTKLLRPSQLQRHSVLRESFNVIAHDGHRTDRRVQAFKSAEGVGLKMLTDLLKTFVIFNPGIGYLQGMNDLFVPILLTYLPEWNDDGMPVNADGEIIAHDSVMANIFWCFHAMLHNVNHYAILRNVTETCRTIALTINHILSKVSPTVVFWLRQYKLDELPWIFSDLVLLFKRSFDDVWGFWCMLNCSPDPKNWLCYMVAGIILLTFTAISEPAEIILTELMVSFPELLKRVDLKRLGRLALVLHELCPLDKPEQAVHEPTFPEFKFFKPNLLRKD
jgi:hypothetical protein